MWQAAVSFIYDEKDGTIFLLSVMEFKTSLKNVVRKHEMYEDV